jgi:molybdopterin converting factor small subunit
MKRMPNQGVTRTVRITLFATAREAVGRSEILLPIPPRGSSVGGILAGLGRDFPSLALVLPSCRFAKNGQYVRGVSTRLAAGDELAVHPPYSGG